MIGPNYVKVTLEPQEIVDANGAVGNGVEDIAARWLNPLAKNLGDFGKSVFL